MAERHDDRGAPDTLESLGDTLRLAARLAAELADEPLFGRLVRVFQAMPPKDRPIVIDAIERDVHARLLSRATEKVTGQAARPNPNARLYVRAFGREAQRGDLERNEMMVATLRAVRVTALLLIPEIYAEWRAATRDALAQVTAEERATVEKLVRDVLELLAECGQADAPAQ